MKKLILLLIVGSFILSIHGMHDVFPKLGDKISGIDFTGKNDPIVTEPYEVGNSSCLLDALLRRPEGVLIKLRNLREKLNDLAESKAFHQLEDEQRFVSWASYIRTCVQECPIFGLTECIEEQVEVKGQGTGEMSEIKTFPCIFNRITYPNRRKILEEKIARTLISCENGSKRPLEYVDFGAGDMYQPFVSLMRTLVRRPSMAINVHYIDSEYMPFVMYRAICGQNRDMERAGDMNVSRELSSVNVELELKYKLFTMLRTHFITYLSKTFPNAHLSFHCYASAKDYISYIRHRSLPYPDVISAADISDGLEDYRWLCNTVCAQQKSARHILLTRNEKDADKVVLIHNLD
jgi:hypothetical protein